MIEIGLHVDNWRHLDTSYDVPCQFAARHGLRHVEFGTIDGEYFVQALGYNPHIPLDSDPLVLRDYLDSLGLRMSQLDAAYPISTPEGQYRGVDYTIKAIRFAAAVGCPCVDTTDGARKPEGYTDGEVMALIRQYYRVVLEHAERYGVIVNVEPHGPYTTDPGTLEDILGASDHPLLRVNFDTGNTFIAGNDPVEFLRRFRDKVSHCHIKDVSEDLARAVRGGETGISTSVVPIGGGANATNIVGCIRLLKETDWSGVLSIEAEAQPGIMEDSVVWLRRQIEDA